MATHARRASATIANRFLQNLAASFSEAHTERGTNVLRRLSLSSASFVKVSTCLWNIALSIAFSLRLTQLLRRYHLQALHQIQPSPQHLRLPPLSQINPAALQLLTPTVGSCAGPLILWENASCQATPRSSEHYGDYSPSSF